MAGLVNHPIITEELTEAITIEFSMLNTNDSNCPCTIIAFVKLRILGFVELECNLITTL